MVKIKKPKSLKKQCDDLWKECIKARAGYKSELSGVCGKQIGGDVILAAHHIIGKPNNRLRFELLNGICIDNHIEHIWGIHNKNNPDLAMDYHSRILKYIGKERHEYLLTLKHCISKDLGLVKIYLEQQLKQFKEKQ